MSKRKGNVSTSHGIGGPKGRDGLVCENTGQILQRGRAVGQAKERWTGRFGWVGGKRKKKVGRGYANKSWHEGQLAFRKAQDKYCNRSWEFILYLVRRIHRTY